MDSFYLTRKEMSQLLLALQAKNNRTPLSILQEAWVKTHRKDVQDGESLGAFIGTNLPPIFAKLIKLQPEAMSFSLSEIVALGSQIEYSHFATTSVQNWVKRDFKDLIGPPAHRKKYSVEQAAILFIIEDLKSSLDFDSIRKLLLLIFHHADDHTRDLLQPVELYAGYSSLFEELDRNNDQVLDLQGQDVRLHKHDHLMEKMLTQQAKLWTSCMPDLDDRQQEVIANALVIATLSVQTSYFQSLSKRFFHATLFLHS